MHILIDLDTYISFSEDNIFWSWPPQSIL